MTKRVEEKIIINNEEFILRVSPLEALIQKINTSTEYKPYDVPKEKEYSAKWIIRDNVLYLKSIEYHDNFKFKNVM